MHAWCPTPIWLFVSIAVGVLQKVFERNSPTDDFPFLPLTLHVLSGSSLQL